MGHISGKIRPIKKHLEISFTALSMGGILCLAGINEYINLIFKLQFLIHFFWFSWCKNKQKLCKNTSLLMYVIHL